MRKTNKKRWIAACAVSALVVAGTAIGMANTVEAKAATSSALTVNAASVRVVDDTYGAGIRFQILMDKSTYTMYAESQNAVLGAKLIPAYYLGTDKIEETASDKVYTATESVWTAYDDGDTDESNDKMQGVVYVYNIPRENYGSDLVIAAYASADGQAELYSEAQTFSLAQVALNADGDEGTQYANYYTFNVSIDGQETTAKYGEKLTNPDATGLYYYTNTAGTATWDFDTMSVKGDVTLIKKLDTDSLVGKNLLDASTVTVKDHWGESEIDGNATIGEGTYSATSTNPSNWNYVRLIAFDTTINTDVLGELKNDYNLQIKYKLTYTWGTGGTVVVAGVEKGVVPTNDMTLTDKTNSQQNGLTYQIFASEAVDTLSERTLTISLENYLWGKEQTQPWAFIIDNAGQSGSAWILTITGVELVAKAPVDPEVEVVWEMGTIYGDNGNTGDASHRIRTADLVAVSSGFEVSINEGYKMKWFAYKADGTYIWRPDNWLTSGFTYEDIVNSDSRYADTAYIKIIFAKSDDSNMTLDDVEASGVELLFSSSTH